MKILPFSVCRHQEQISIRFLIFYPGPGLDFGYCHHLRLCACVRGVGVWCVGVDVGWGGGGVVVVWGCGVGVGSLSVWVSINHELVLAITC